MIKPYIESQISIEVVEWAQFATKIDFKGASLGLIFAW